MSGTSSKLVFTPVKSIPKLVAEARATYNAGTTRSMEWRIQQLNNILRLCEENKDAFVTALQGDLKRPEMECVIAEVLTVVAETKHALSHIREWVKPVAVATPPVLLPGSSYVQPDPLGVVCIIAPWNFPIQLILNVLVGAIAAGNAAVIKPSEVSANCAVLVEQLINKYLDTNAFKIVQGGVDETTELLKQPFDHIFYTGNGGVAKHVMKAAAEHLTPVTLELGGKSPVIVTEDANLDLAAKRIVLAKCLNAGQVCIAPDYIMVQRSVADQLVDRMIATARQFYGDDMKQSESFGRIINSRHFDRVNKLLKSAGGSIAYGGDVDAATNFVSLTIIRDPPLTAGVMQEEIFGPLLPVITIDKVDDAINHVNAHPKPLALYVFTSNDGTARKVLTETTSGGAIVNDCIVHNAVCDLPFGGVGASGMGAYHGKYGFDTFSHRKAVFEQATKVDPGMLRYPPYSKAQLNRLEWVFKVLPPLPRICWKDVALAGLSAAVTVLAYKLYGEDK